jgi:hypothetical protein
MNLPDLLAQHKLLNIWQQVFLLFLQPFRM